MEFSVISNQYYNKITVDLIYQDHKYWASVHPVKVERRDDMCSITFTMSATGIRFGLNEAARRSKKAEAVAQEIIKANLAHMIEAVCNKNGIAVSDVEF